MNPEQRFFIVRKYLAVKINVFLFCTFIGMLRPERVCLVQRYGTLFNLKLCHLFLGRLRAVLTRNFFFLLECLYNNIIFPLILRVNCLKLLRGICLLEINLIWHKRTVFLDDFPRLVFIAERKTVLVDEKGNLCADCCPVTVCHDKLRAAVTFPMYGLCALLIGQGINMHFVRHHKCGIKS